MPLVDGTRDPAAHASAVKQIAVNIDPLHAQDFVIYALEKFARLGLLMPDGDALAAAEVMRPALLRSPKQQPAWFKMSDGHLINEEC